MDFGLREWMILIGGLLIIAVVVDGLRRMLADRRNMIRMGMSYQDDEDDYDESAEYNPELPSGGARPTARRADDMSEPSLGSLDISPEEEVAPPPETAAAVTEESISPRPKFSMPKMSMPKIALPKGGIVRDAKSVFTRSAVKNQPEVLAEDSADDLAAGLDLPEWSDPDSALETSAMGAAGLPASPALPDEVLVINVVSRDNNGFNGADLLEVLLACDVRYGEMDIFHRHEGAQGQGNVQFSVANLVKPGSFDLASIKTFYTPGISLFMQLPGPEQPSVAFDCMAETAACLVKNLQGEMRDERHSILTQQTLEHYRQRIVEYERKRLARAPRQA